MSYPSFTSGFVGGLLLLAPLSHAQQVQQSIPQPEYRDQYVAVLNGQLVPLERETAVADTKSRRNFVITPSMRVFESIPQPASPVRVLPGTHFLVRLATGDLDPQTLVHLQPLKATNKDREIPIVTYKQSLIPFGGVKHERAANETVAITIRKFGGETLEIVPQAPLPPGEYAFVSGHQVQCFGVDAGNADGTSPPAASADLASATPSHRATPPPAPVPPPPPPHPAATALDVAPGAPGYPALHATTQAMDGCWWAAWVSQRYSLEMLVQRCEPGKGFGGVNTVFEDNAQGVTARPENEQQSTLLFSVQTKPALQSLSAAVRQQFIAKEKLTPARKAACHLKEDPKDPKDIGPVESYSVTGPCTELESDDAVGRAFLYIPTESRTKYLFLQTEDAWPFDSASIRFLPEQ